MTDDIDANIAELEQRIAQEQSSFVRDILQKELEALRGQQPPASGAITAGNVAGQGVAIGDGAQATSQEQRAGGNIIGSPQYVLRQITIADGGTLIVGQPPADLPPNAEAVREALAGYLRTLLQQYQFLSLRGLGTGGQQQARIELQAVFINLLTNVTITEAAALFPEQEAPRGRSQRRPAESLTPDLQQWLAELLTPDERATLSRAALTPSDQLKELQQRLAAPLLKELQRRLTAPRTALELIRHSPALVLLGDPGSGKTTVLRHLALSFALARLQAGDPGGQVAAPVAWSGPLPLPLLVQLRRFAATLKQAPTGAGALLGFLEQTLSEQRVAALAQHLQQRLEAGEGLVLLDGLDEVADDTHRRWVLDAVTAFQQRFARSRIVLTSRIYAYRDPFTLPPPFDLATLQPLDEAEQDAFIQRWYRAALLDGSDLPPAEREPAAVERARDLVESLTLRPRLREIARNPLLLTMTALVHLNHLELPHERARLYEQCLLLLLEQWEKRDARSEAGLAVVLGLHERLTSDAERLQLIQPVAYQLQLLGREEARNAEVCTWLLERFLDYAPDKQGARGLIQRFLVFLEGRSGLLIARDRLDRYAFPHKTFQEYLAARELIYQGQQALLAEVVRQRHAPTWREVILLVVGHLVVSGQPEQARVLGWQLLEADAAGTPEAYRTAVLVGEVVEELGSHLGRDGPNLRDEVVGNMVALIEGGHLPARERVEAAFLLGRLVGGADPRLPTPDQAAYWCPIAAGPFWYGNESEIGENKNEEMQQVTLPYPYRIGRYPVTNAEYARFIAAGGYDPDQPWWTEQGRKCISPEGRRGFLDDDLQKSVIPLPRLWNDSHYNNPAQPVVGVSWFEAAAYCRWLTAQGHTQGWLPEQEEIRLPTSLEWERAARHTDQRPYPWGEAEPTPEHANYQETEIGRPSPVGCFPAGAAVCGAQDMAGNVWEWTATHPQVREQMTPKKDFDPTSRDRVMFSWSMYDDKKAELLCGSQGWNNPINRYDYQGMRLVRSLLTSGDSFEPRQ